MGPTSTTLENEAIATASVWVLSPIAMRTRLPLDTHPPEVLRHLARGCPEFRGTSVAARLSSGCVHGLIMTVGTDSLLGDMPLEGGS